MGKTVAVIGAGPGGFFAAKEAARQGLAVSVFTKDRVDGAVNCAEGFFDVLKLLEPPAAGICFKIRGSVCNRA